MIVFPHFLPEALPHSVHLFGHTEQLVKQCDFVNAAVVNMAQGKIRLTPPLEMCIRDRDSALRPQAKAAASWTISPYSSKNRALEAVSALKSRNWALDGIPSGLNQDGIQPLGFCAFCRKSA